MYGRTDIITITTGGTNIDSLGIIIITGDTNTIIDDTIGGHVSIITGGANIDRITGRTGDTNIYGLRDATTAI